MSDDDRAARILEDAKRNVEADGNRLLTGEFQPSICFFTDNPDVPRLILLPEMNDRNEVAWALNVIAASLDNLTAITFSVDTYAHKVNFQSPPESVGQARSLMLKLDGTEWRPGEMQDAWLNNTPDKALITEAYTYQASYSDGTYAMLSVPYVRDEAAGTIEFDWETMKKPFVTGRDDDADAARAGGFFPDAMAHAHEVPKLISLIEDKVGVAEALGLEEWQARLHAMAAAVKLVMQQTAWPVMIPAWSEEEKELIDHSFNEGPFSEGIRTYGKDDVDEIVALQEAFDKPAVGSPEWFDSLPTQVSIHQEDQ